MLLTQLMTPSVTGSDPNAARAAGTAAEGGGGTGFSDLLAKLAQGRTSAAAETVTPGVTSTATPEADASGDLSPSGTLAAGVSASADGGDRGDADDNAVAGDGAGSETVLTPPRLSSDQTAHPALSASGGVMPEGRTAGTRHPPSETPSRVAPLSGAANDRTMRVSQDARGSQSERVWPVRVAAGPENGVVAASNTETGAGLVTVSGPVAQRGVSVAAGPSVTGDRGPELTAAENAPPLPTRPDPAFSTAQTAPEGGSRPSRLTQDLSDATLPTGGSERPAATDEAGGPGHAAPPAPETPDQAAASETASLGPQSGALPPWAGYSAPLPAGAGPETPAAAQVASGGERIRRIVSTAPVRAGVGPVADASFRGGQSSGSGQAPADTPRIARTVNAPERSQPQGRAGLGAERGADIAGQPQKGLALAGAPATAAGGDTPPETTISAPRALMTTQTAPIAQPGSLGPETASPPSTGPRGAVTTEGGVERADAARPQLSGQPDLRSGLATPPSGAPATAVAAATAPVASAPPAATAAQASPPARETISSGPLRAPGPGLSGEELSPLAPTGVPGAAGPTSKPAAGLSGATIKALTAATPSGRGPTSAPPVEARPELSVTPGADPVATRSEQAPVGETAKPASQAAPAPNSASLSALLGDRVALSRHVSQQIRLPGGTETRTQITLRPDGLGAVEIELTTDPSGKLALTLRAENPAVLQALRADRDLLLMSLERTGAELDGARLDFEGFGEGTGSGAEDRKRAPSPYGPLATTADVTAPVSGPAARTPLIGGGRIDLYT